MEGIKNPKRSEQPPIQLEDYADNPVLYGLLSRLPQELQNVHMGRIEHLNDEEATGYLYALHERRDAALRESVVSDERLEPYFTDHEAEIWQALETHVFTSAENHIGAGTTARIKRYDIDGQPLAVKYLVTPTEKTLSASGEHDLILELEQMEAIERAELDSLGENAQVKVPHPYFYYQKGKLQCYGMELIDGANLEQATSGNIDPKLKEEYRESFSGIDREAFMQEIDTFFDTMHGICLHGDVKPRNLMVSREGKLYVIDFGQAVLATSVTEKSGEAFETLKDDEKRNARMAFAFFLDSLNT